MGRRLLRAAGIVFVSLVALEVLLQLAGIFVRGSLDRAVVGRPDSVRILCVGDSHTFGAGVSREESYPAQLAARLADRHPGMSFDVLNLGVPGANTRFIANRLEEQLLELRPQLLIVWAGVNNLWNVAEMEGDASFPTRARRWLLRLKLARLASVVWYTRREARYQDANRTGELPRPQDWFVMQPPPGGKLDGTTATQSIVEDLDEIVATSRALDVPVLLLDYPWYFDGYANRPIQQAEERLGVAVVRTLAALKQARADGHPTEELSLGAAGPHPTGLLYGYIVEAMLPAVEALLADAGLLGTNSRPPSSRSTGPPRSGER